MHLFKVEESAFYSIANIYCILLWPVVSLTKSDSVISKELIRYKVVHLLQGGPFATKWSICYKVVLLL